jgi:plasmid stabilization system protein ParE
MMRTIKLSRRASRKLDKLLDYLESEWSTKVKNDFIKKLDKSLRQIQKYPNSCQQSDSIVGLHMLVISKQTSVFYRFNSKTITIVTIFDNRMNPDRLKNEVK